MKVLEGYRSSLTVYLPMGLKSAGEDVPLRIATVADDTPPKAMRTQGALVPSALLAFDCGPTKSGWALVSLGSEPLVHAVGEVDATPEDACALVQLLAAAAPARVAVEIVEGYAFQAARTRQLLATNRTAGLIHGLVLAMGVEVSAFSSQTWRKAVVGKPAPTDAEISKVLAGLVSLPWRTNSHERDAVGVALATRLALGLPVATRAA